MTRQFFISTCVLICTINNACFSHAGAPATLVRVAVLKDVKTFDLSIRGKYRIVDPQTGGGIDHGKRLANSTVSVTQDGIVIGDHEYGIRRLRIIVQKDAAIYWNGKKHQYREQIDILLTKNDKLLVVNSLDIESYVRGVLYHEVPHRWPINAIKVQAVATRTYALYQTISKKKQEYDVTSDIYSQVYGGRSAERHRTNIAANSTRGEILTYKGKILPAYFHSNCGGRTEDVAELWKQDLPPLKGVVCGFCTGAPNYQWKKNFQSKDIQEKLNAQGYQLGLIKDIAVLNRNGSGRIKDLKITTRDGKSTIISGIKFREIIGPNVLKSNRYTIDMKGYFFDVNGRGWGHGVGMCQWGAYHMAKKRYKYTSILAYYYPGADMTKISKL